MFGVTSATLGFLRIFATLTVLYILSNQTIISRDSIMLKIYFVEIEQNSNQDRCQNKFTMKPYEATQFYEENTVNRKTKVSFFCGDMKCYSLLNSLMMNDLQAKACNLHILVPSGNNRLLDKPVNKTTLIILSIALAQIPYAHCQSSHKYETSKQTSLYYDNIGFSYYTLFIYWRCEFFTYSAKLDKLKKALCGMLLVCTMHIFRVRQRAEKLQIL